MPRFYALEKVEAHKQGRRAEYTRLIKIFDAPSFPVALQEAREKFGEKITVEAANKGYREGR